MSGFLAYVALVGAVALLIPFPVLWPIVVGLALVALFDPRPDGGKRSGEREA